MKMPIDKEWFEKRAAAEGDLEIGAGNPDYIPPFIPSAADSYYSRIVAQCQFSIKKLTMERDLLQIALQRYGDKSKMGFVEPPELQQAIDDALAANPSPQPKSVASNTETKVWRGHD